MDYTRDPAQHGLSPHQIAALAAGRINANRVASRSESGKRLSYVEAWDIKATLIKVFGYGGFSAEVIESDVIRVFETPQKRDPNKMNTVAICKATVRLTIHATGAVYTEVATGQNSQPDAGKAIDTAFKSAESDALKRAAIYLGTQFGLSLYAGTHENVCAPIVEQDQAAALAQLYAERTSGEQGQQTQAALDRATTRTDPNLVAEDAAAEAASYAAGEESQEPTQNPDEGGAPMDGAGA